MNAHYRKTRRKYVTLRNGDVTCPFCDRKTLQKPIFETDSFFVIQNRTPYDLWELHDVIGHLLVVPKKHVESISELSDAEIVAIMRKIAEYETEGYNVYMRGAHFMRRSVGHQHTHLIKAADKEPRFSLFLKKPYFLIKY